MTNETHTAAPVSLEALEREWRTYAATAEQHADHSVAPENREWYMGRSEAFTECADDLATLRLAQSGVVGAWVSVNDRLPEDGTECLVIAKYGNDPKFYRVIDTWRMQREAPVSFSSATIETGLMWDDHDFDDVLFWQPLPAPPAITPPSAKGEDKS